MKKLMILIAMFAIAGTASASIVDGSFSVYDGVGNIAPVIAKLIGPSTPLQNTGWATANTATSANGGIQNGQMEWARPLANMAIGQVWTDTLTGNQHVELDLTLLDLADVTTPVLRVVVYDTTGWSGYNEQLKISNLTTGPNVVTLLDWTIDLTTASLGTISSADFDTTGASGHYGIALQYTGVDGGSANNLSIDNVSIPGSVAATSIMTSVGSLNVTEGTTNSFDVRLNSLPAASVTVNVGHTAGSANLEVVSGSESLTFTTGDWDTWQTVYIEALSDADNTNDVATITCTDAGATYTLEDVQVTQIDTDIPDGLIVDFPGGNLVDAIVVSSAAGSTGQAYVEGTALMWTANTGYAGPSIYGGFGSSQAGWVFNTVQARDSEDGDWYETGGNSPTLNNGANVFALHLFDLGGTYAVTNLTGRARSGYDQGIATTRYVVKDDGAYYISDKVGSAGLLDELATTAIGWWDYNPLSDINAIGATNATVDLANVTMAGIQSLHVMTNDLTRTGVSMELFSAWGTDTGAPVEKNVETSFSSLNVTEGTTNSFLVRLGAQPAADVTVNVSRSSGSTNLQVVPGSESLVFTVANWEAWQTVYIEALSDADYLNDTATITCADAGGTYTFKDVQVTQIDTTIDPTKIDTSVSSLNVTEGSTSSFDVSLGIQPAANVTVNVSRSSGSTNLQVVPGSESVVFTVANWDVGQTVYIEALSDADYLNDTATITCVDAGGTYTLKDVQVTQIDTNIPPGLIVIFPGGDIVTTPEVISSAAGSTGQAYVEGNALMSTAIEGYAGPSIYGGFGSSKAGWVFNTVQARDNIVVGDWYETGGNLATLLTGDQVYALHLFDLGGTYVVTNLTGQARSGYESGTATTRYVVKDDGAYYISDVVGSIGSLTALAGSGIAWYDYNPLSDINAIGAINATVDLANVTMAGIQSLHVMTADLTRTGVNMQLFSAWGIDTGAPPEEISDVGFSLAPGGEAVISWQGDIGVTYAVQRTPDLVFPAWSNIVTGLSGTEIISVTNDTTDPKAFYRTIVQ